MDLDGFLKRVASSNGSPAGGRQEGGRRAAGGRAGGGGRARPRVARGRVVTTACTMFAQDSRLVRNSFHDKEAAAPLHKCTCTSPYAFLRRVGMHAQVLLSAMHVQICTLDRCCEHQRTHLLHDRYRMCICDRYRERYICMCICIHIYIYVYVHIHAYVYVYVSMYICMCMCMYMYIYMYVRDNVVYWKTKGKINNDLQCMCVYIYISLYIACMCSLFHLALENEDEGVQLVYESACCLAWGVILTEGKIGVLSVSSLFFKVNAGESVCVCVCVYTHTHTHTAQMRYLDVSPGVGMRHLEGPKNSDGLNLGLNIFVYVYKVHMCMCMLGGEMRSWNNCFFL